MKFPRRITVYPAVTISLAVSAAVLLLFFVLYIIVPVRILSHVALSDDILPVSITVYGRGSDTISARVTLYSADWTMLNTVERSWTGWEIGIETLLVHCGDGWILFPLTVGTDETREGQGVEVVRYYSRSDFPALYESPRITGRERTALRRLFFLARHGLWGSSGEGRFRITKAILREFETGTEYFLYVDQSGTLSFR